MVTAPSTVAAKAPASARVPLLLWKRSVTHQTTATTAATPATTTSTVSTLSLVLAWPSVTARPALKSAKIPRLAVNAHNAYTTLSSAATTRHPFTAAPPRRLTTGAGQVCCCHGEPGCGRSTAVWSTRSRVGGPEYGELGGGYCWCCGPPGYPGG